MKTATTTINPGYVLEKDHRCTSPAQVHLPFSCMFANTINMNNNEPAPPSKKVKLPFMVVCVRE